MILGEKDIRVAAEYRNVRRGEADRHRLLHQNRKRPTASLPILTSWLAAMRRSLQAHWPARSKSEPASASKKSTVPPNVSGYGAGAQS